MMINTKITDEQFLVRALQKMGHQPLQGRHSARGFNGRSIEVDVLIRTKSSGYDVGFRKEGKYYVCVADWMGVNGINQQEFIQNLNQHYATLVVKDKLEKQGFALAEEVKVDGRIHLTLRRTG